MLLRPGQLSDGHHVGRGLQGFRPLTGTGQDSLLVPSLGFPHGEWQVFAFHLRGKFTDTFGCQRRHQASSYRRPNESATWRLLFFLMQGAEKLVRLIGAEILQSGLSTQISTESALSAVTQLTLERRSVHPSRRRVVLQTTQLALALGCHGCTTD